MGIYTEKREQLIEKIKELEKLRSSGLSDEELLEMVGINSANSSNANNDDIKFYDEPDNEDD